MYFEPTNQQKADNPSNKDNLDLEKVDFDSFNSIFSLRKPKDLKAGLSSATKSIAKGFLVGTFSLVGAPVVGAISDGWGGFAKGLGIGEHLTTGFSTRISRQEQHAFWVMCFNASNPGEGYLAVLCMRKGLGINRD